jgi:lambda family phage minor tail protein L
MVIISEIQSMSPSAIMELFVLDMTNIPGGVISYFHAGTNGLTQPVIWQGATYSALPIEASGFDMSTKGTLPRPRVRVANVNGMFSSLVAANADLIGCKVTRKRTFARYLDAANFPGGVNPAADPTQFFSDDTWIIDMKMSENKYIIEWELSSSLDVQGVRLPFRQVVQNCCTWTYRSAECGYAGVSYFTTNDTPTTQVNDFCSKRLSSCKIRHPTGPLPYGGFPGALRYGQ